MHTDNHLQHCVLGDSRMFNRTTSSIGRVVQQLVATVGCLATLMLLWKVPTVAAKANNVGPIRLVINSTSDALRLSWAASQVGVTVDAVVMGSVKVDVPIQIGNFSRLSITGHGEGAQLKFSGRPMSSIGADFHNANSNITKGNGKIISEFFDVMSNASLAVETLTITEQQQQQQQQKQSDDDDTIGTSLPAVLIKLHPGSLVETNGCTLHADTLISDAERGSTDVSTYVVMTHATGSRESLSNCGISWVQGQAQPLEKQTKSADERRVNISVEERSMTAWGDDEDYQRRLNGNKCPQGYDGASCNDCASGFSMDPDGECERTEVQCTVWTEFGGGVLAVLGIVVLILIMDSIRNGKSPPHRVAQIWGKAVDCCCTSSGEKYCQDTNWTSEQPSEKANKDTNWCGRESLGRFFHGCMAFVVTSQIVSQGAQVLELKLPSAMNDVVIGLEWTNMDPLLVPVACSFTRASFLDRTVGTVGLLTAFLTVLILSQIAIATGRNAPRGNKELAETRSSTISRFLRWDAVRDTGDVRSSSSRQPGEASSARVRGLAVWRDKGAWEQWNKWDSLERHVIAAVMACLLMYPVVCTMLLRVFDCKKIEGDDGLWLRSDLSIECSSVQHQHYRVVAGIFLGLYGIGIPVAFAALVMWAKGIDDDTNTDNNTSFVSKAVRVLKRSFSTSDSNNLPLREMTTADAIASEEGRVRGGLASGTKISNRDRTGVEHTAPQETSDGALASNCPSRMDREKGEGGNRSGRQISRGEARWSDICCHDGSHDANPNRTSLMGMKNSYLGRAWMISGRFVLSVDSLAGRSAPSALDDHYRGNHWRCTLPLWSPYCTNRHWFAAWDLARRTLLTGVLTLIPADGGAMMERAAVACAMAGLSLVAAEVARPYRDPWIGWIYRIGGIVILLVDILGLLQEVWAEDSRSPSVITIEAFFLLFLILMMICICCGWRLSLAEQHAIDTTTIIPWPESVSFREPSDVVAGPGPIHPDRCKNSPNPNPDGCVSWYKEEPILAADSSNPKEKRSSKRSISSCGSDYSPNTSRRSWSRPWPKTEPEPDNVQNTAADATTLEAIRDGKVNDESIKWDDDNCRSITHSNGFGCSMLSRSPRTMGILHLGLGFNSVGGCNSSELRVPIDTHQTPSGRVFHSNTIEIGARKIPRPDLSNYGTRGNFTPPLTRCHSGSDVNSNTVGEDDSQAQKRTTVPIIAPGAPSIDGHKSRFSSRRNPLSSSFSSTSFESSTPEDRSRKRLEGAAGRRRGAWRLSRSSSGFFSQSRSSSGFFSQSRSSSGSQSGDLNRSPVMASSLDNGGSKASFKGSRNNTRSNTGGSSLFNFVSTTSGSFMSCGSSSSSISSLTNSASVPPVLRALQTASSPIVEDELWTTNSPDGSKKGWPLAKRGWPLDLPAVSEMPAHLIKKGDEMTRGPSMADVPVTVERETTSPKVANSEGRSNIIKYRAILWRGGSGPSSCDSRVSEGKKGNTVCTDVGKPRVDDSSRSTIGDRMKTSCSSPELKHDVDIEGGGQLDENPVSLMHDGVHVGNVKTDNGAME